MQEEINVEYSYTLVTRKFENLSVTFGSRVQIDYVDEEDRQNLIDAHKEKIKEQFLDELKEAVKDVKELINGG